MKHLSEEDLVLHYYGDHEDALEAERHMEECEDCRSLFASLQRALNLVDAVPAPEPDAGYGQRVWRRIEGRLPARRSWLPELSPWRWAVAGTAFAGLLAAAFLVGRFYPPAPDAAPAVTAADRESSRGVLLVAMGDYLERSQMVLIELANADPKGEMDISAQQERAGDLVSEARLYRQSAAHNGDAAVTNLLEELERVLVEIKNESPRISPADLARIRERLRGEGILFKIRVLGSSIRLQEEPVDSDGRRTL